MSLQVWLPLDGTLENKGLSDLTFAPVDSHTTSAQSGKLTNKCYYNDSGLTDSNNNASNGGIISNKKLHVGNNISMFAWVKLTAFNPSSLASLTGIGGMHTIKHINGADYANRTGMGITVHGSGKISFTWGDGVGGLGYVHQLSNDTISLNSWNHIGFTCERHSDETSTVTLYINGNASGSFHQTEVLSNPDDYVHVFSWTRDGQENTPTIFTNYKPKGYINDFRIYDHTLSKKEVRELAKGLRLHYQLKSPRLTDLFAANPLNIYNNYGVSSTLVATGEYFMGQPVYRLTMTPSNASGCLSSFQNDLHSHGVWQGIMTYSARTKYCYWIYFRPVSHSNITVGGIASNQHGWTEIPQHYFGDGWYRVGQYRNGTVTNDVSDNIYTSFKTPSAAVNVPITIDFCAPCFISGSDQIVETFGPVSTDNIEPDVSGFNNHAVVHGTVNADANSPKYKNSYHFPSTGYISSATMDFTETSNSFTVAYWAKMPVGAITGKMVWGISGSSYLDVYPSESRLHWNVGDSYDNPFYDSATGTYPYPNDGNWHHYAISGNGSENILYIDGKRAAKSTTYKGLPTSANLFLSGWDAGNNYRWSGGNTSDFRIYATCLSESDVMDLCKVGASVSKDGTLLAHEVDEFNSARKSGTTRSGLSTLGVSNTAFPIYDMKLTALEDRSVWGRIHYLDVSTDQTYFANANEVAKCLNKNNRYSRLGDIKKFKSQSMLPSGYTQLEYIEASGTQHIDTGFIPNNRTSIELDFQYLGSRTGTDVHNLFGARTSTYEKVFAMWINSTNAFPHYGNVSYTDHGAFTLTTTDRNIYKYNKNIATAGSETITCTETTFNSGYSLCLFTMKDSTGIDTRKAPGRLYGCKIYDDDKLVRNYVPCRRDDGAVGLYDLVDDVFYSNAGSGAFAAGEFVSKYEFMLRYPNLSQTGYNRWSQTSDISESSVSGYRPISISWPEHSYGIRAHNTGSCIYNCDSGGTWYAPIGQLGHGSWNGDGSMIPAANGTNTSMMELWIRLDTCPAATQFKIYDGAVTATNYIEI